MFIEDFNTFWVTAKICELNADPGLHLSGLSAGVYVPEYSGDSSRQGLAHSRAWCRYLWN